MQDSRYCDHVPVELTLKRTDTGAVEKVIKKNYTGMMRGESAGCHLAAFCRAALPALSKFCGFVWIDKIRMSGDTLRLMLTVGDDEMGPNNVNAYRHILTNKKCYGRDLEIDDTLPFNTLVFSSFMNEGTDFIVTYKYITEEEADANAI